MGRDGATLLLKECTREDAKAAVGRWHYSRSMPTQAGDGGASPTVALSHPEAA